MKPVLQVASGPGRPIGYVSFELGTILGQIAFAVLGILNIRSASQDEIP
jgi:hypothetical protein